MRLGIAHHLGWAVAVTASDDLEVVDRRRIELIEPDMPVAPIHHEGGAHSLHRKGKTLDDNALTTLVAKVRASVYKLASAAFDDLSESLGAPIIAMSLRAWPTDFPDDIAIQRRVPYESRTDSIMYLEVLAELGRARGWATHLYDTKKVELEASSVLGERAADVLYGPRKRLGPPWSKDHRMALAAIVLQREERGDT